MVIAFDIDGVLTDFESFLMKYGKKYFSSKFGDEFCKNIDSSEYSFEKMFNVDEKEKVKFYTKYLFWYALKYPLREGFAELTQSLHQKGDKIVIISSRALAEKDNILGFFMRQAVKKTLCKNNIYYDEIFFCNNDYSSVEKLKICKQEFVDIIVEDSPENIECLSKEIKVLCFNASYNSHIENVSKVYTADDIFIEIEKIRNSNKNDYINLLSYNDRKSLSQKDLVKYFEKLQNTYQKIPYDIKKEEKKELEYLKAVKNLKPIFDHFIPYQVLGKQYIPKKEPFIIACNHRTMADPPAIMSAIGDISPNTKLRLLAKSSFLDIPGISIFLKNIGIVFVDRNNENSRKYSKSECMKLISHGSNLIIFPEGTRNKTNKPLLKYNRGAFEISQAMQVPIVPCGIFHLNNKPVIMNFGKPIQVRYDDDLDLVINDVQEITIDLINKSKQKINIKSKK